MNIASIIKYEGDNSTFIWKHPSEDFNIGSQLIVHESQEAVFFLNGQALDLFGAGRHTLETENIPLVRNLINTPFNSKTPFHCEVYFINKTEQMAIKWGTDSRVQFVEPTYKFPISIGASGEMSLRVDDSRKLLIKLVGTEKYLGQQQITGYFRAFLMTKVKAYLAATIREKSISVFEIDEHLNEISDNLKAKLQNDFNDYGIALERFFVTTILKPDGEPNYEKFKNLYFRQYADVTEAQIRQKVQVIDAETDAQKTVIDSKAQAVKRQQEGYTYSQERGFDVAEKVADNEAVGQFTNMGVGLGTMAGVGGAVGGVVGGAINSAMGDVNLNSQQPQSTAQALNSFCGNCGAKLAVGMKFCSECGTPVAVVSVAPLCKSCGYKFESPMKFCPNCGTKQEG